MYKAIRATSLPLWEEAKKEMSRYAACFPEQMGYCWECGEIIDQRLLIHDIVPVSGYSSILLLKGNLGYERLPSGLCLPCCESLNRSAWHRTQEPSGSKEMKTGLRSYMELATLLKAPDIFKKGEVTLSAGGKSNYYIDAKKLSLHGAALKLISTLMLDLLPEGTRGVGGVTLGADPIVGAMIANSDKPLDGFLIRKEEKGHGMKKLVEGTLCKGMKVAVVEDVTTTGASLMHAVKTVWDNEADVLIAMSIVDRQEGATELFAKAGIPFKPLLKVSDL